MKVLCHLDPATLERELIRQLSAAAEDEPRGQALVVVPSARLADHAQRRLAESRPVWLGVEVLHFRALARRILEKVGAREPRQISTRLLDAILDHVLRRHGDNAWSRLVRRRPGALRAISRTLRDLRDGGIRPGELAICVESIAPQADLAPLYQAYFSELDRLAGDGWVDDAGLIGAAIPHAPDFAAVRSVILLHGAYEVIGIHLDLLRALDHGREIVALMPFERKTPVSAFAEGFADRHLLQGGSVLERLPASGVGKRLAFLWNEESRPEPAPEGRFLFRHTQGAAAEVKLAVRLAIDAVRKGCAPCEVIIAARSLSPYVESIEAAFHTEDLPWTTSLTTPLRREPVIHDLMLVFELLAQDFPRRATAEALRSPRIRWSSLLGGDMPPRGDRADRWSRRAGIVGGLEEWIQLLDAWATDPETGSAQGSEYRETTERRSEACLEEVRRIGRALKALSQQVQPSCQRRWGEHADVFAELTKLLLGTEVNSTHPGLETMKALFDEMRCLESLAGDTGPIPFADAVRWLGEAVDGAELAPHRADSGGVRVLDAMQARGLTCRCLILLGMNSAQFPHAPREDPVLPDAFRIRLREETKRPIPVKSEGALEERLLLGLLLGSAADRVEVSWQRADESGRARTPSLALRELSRLETGRPDIELLLKRAEHVPSHPEHWLEWLAEDAGLLDSAQMRLLTVFRTGRPAEELGEFHPELAAGLKLLRATESFHEVDSRYDGRVGPPPAERAPWSVTALETLGLCPLKHFFDHRLRVRELDEEPGAFEIAARDLGGLVHRLLEEIYGRLATGGAFECPSGTELQECARKLLNELWPKRMAGLRGRISRRAPALWRMLEQNWITAVGAFLALDLKRLQSDNWGAPQLEHEMEGTISIGNDREVSIRGRLDRRFETAQGPVVGDYKTGSIEELVDVGSMLKGSKLQVPLYWLLAGRGTVEILGVGPRHNDPSNKKPVRLLFAGFKKEIQEKGFLETMGTLVTLAERGCFPLHSRISHCRWCAWALARRRNHPPTLEREGRAADAEDYRLTLSKTPRDKPTLGLARGIL